MELKNALAVCLISLFSATLVLLVARSLDNQAAARLEPHLARIVDELEAIRKHGGVAGDSQPFSEPDGMIVYYFHSTQRCATCRAIESQAYGALQSGFAEAVKSGEIVWKVANYEDNANAGLTDHFDIQASVVVLAKMGDGEIVQWKRLDEVWALRDDEPAFAAFMHREIRAILAGEKATDNS